MKLIFNDGITFETDGNLRIEKTYDGLYILGHGLLDGTLSILSKIHYEIDLLRQQLEPKRYPIIAKGYKIFNDRSAFERYYSSSPSILKGRKVYELSDEELDKLITNIGHGIFI